MEPLLPPAPTQSEEEASRLYQEGIASEPQVVDPLVQAIQDQVGENMFPIDPNAGPSFFNSPLSEELMENEIFRCTNLTKSYGKGASYHEVIKGISFSVKAGEYVVIYGPSGSGKSTLLNLLAGLEIPNRGEIRIKNQVIQKFTDEELAIYHREKIDLVFQNFNLLESLRVWENVAFPLMLAGAPFQWRQHEALHMLKKFDMADFAAHFPNQLSGGQQQRVGLARALVHDPEILLVDEPTGNLDSVSAQVVITEIDRLHKSEERTIILVTHSPIFLPFADRVFYIKDGTLLTSDEHSRLNSNDGSAVPGSQLPAPQ